MKQPQSNVPDQIKKIVAEKAPGAMVFLYGSRSMGTARKTSDWDFLILLNKDKIAVEDEQQITSPLYDFEFETGEIISPVIYSEREWNTKYSITPFYRNVMREGRLL